MNFNGEHLAHERGLLDEDGQELTGYQILPRKIRKFWISTE